MYRYIRKVSFRAQQSLLELIFAHFKGKPRLTNGTILGILMFDLSSLILKGKLSYFYGRCFWFSHQLLRNVSKKGVLMVLFTARDAPDNIAIYWVRYSFIQKWYRIGSSCRPILPISDIIAIFLYQCHPLGMFLPSTPADLWIFWIAWPTLTKFWNRLD